MTHIPKSDAQLDAEAERGPVEPRIKAHRAMWQASLYVPRLAARQPPTSFNHDTLGWEVEDGARSGMPMSGPMMRRISESPGAKFPWPTAFGRLRWKCIGRVGGHPAHRASDKPYWRGALCWEAVRLTIIGGEKGIPFLGPLSKDEAAGILRLEEIDPLLHNAFDDIEREMRRILLMAERRANEDAGQFHVHELAPPPHHGVPGLHQADCPQCRAA